MVDPQVIEFERFWVHTVLVPDMYRTALIYGSQGKTRRTIKMRRILIKHMTWSLACCEDFVTHTPDVTSERCVVEARTCCVQRVILFVTLSNTLSPTMALVSNDCATMCDVHLT